MKYKAGQKVICIPGFSDYGVGIKTQNYGGSGYKADKIFEIKNTDNYDGYQVLWPIDNGPGVYCRAVKLYDEEPNYEIF